MLCGPSSCRIYHFAKVALSRHAALICKILLNTRKLPQHWKIPLNTSSSTAIVRARWGFSLFVVFVYVRARALSAYTVYVDFLFWHLDKRHLHMQSHAPRPWLLFIHYTHRINCYYDRKTSIDKWRSARADLNTFGTLYNRREERSQYANFLLTRCEIMWWTFSRYHIKVHLNGILPNESTV